MSHCFITWIDSWTDRFNPITVRDLKRLKGWKGLEGFTIFIQTGLIMAVGGMLLLGFHPSFSFPKPTETALMVSGLVVTVTGYGIFAACFTSLNRLVKSRKEDELFELVPLTPKQQVHGYLASSCILSIYFFGMTLPFLMTATLIGPVPWPMHFVPIGVFLLGQVLLLFGLSFLARTKGTADFILVAFLGYIGIAPLELPWFGVITLWNEVFHWPTLHWNTPIGFVTFFYFLPTAVAILGFVSYRLSILHFALRRKPAYKAAVFNIFVYSLLSTVLAGIYFVVAWCVHR